MRSGEDVMMLSLPREIKKKEMQSPIAIDCDSCLEHFEAVSNAVRYSLKKSFNMFDLEKASETYLLPNLLLRLCVKILSVDDESCHVFCP